MLKNILWFRRIVQCGSSYVFLSNLSCLNGGMRSLNTCCRFSALSPIARKISTCRLSCLRKSCHFFFSLFRIPKSWRIRGKNGQSQFVKNARKHVLKCKHWIWIYFCPLGMFGSGRKDAWKLTINSDSYTSKCVFSQFSKVDFNRSFPIPFNCSNILSLR